MFTCTTGEFPPEHPVPFTTASRDEAAPRIAHGDNTAGAGDGAGGGEGAGGTGAGAGAGGAGAGGVGAGDGVGRLAGGGG